MRAVVRLTIALLALSASAAPLSASAQTSTTRGPLEDVTLRGRVLHPDGSPVANTPVRVDAVNDSGFAILGFFFTAGFSTLACFTADKEMCPLPNSKRYASATDASGNYSFTFHNAHHRGEQTDTDYIFSVGVASTAARTQIVVASYELELQDPVHAAPDVRVWDPEVRLSASRRYFRALYDKRGSSKNGGQVLIDNKPTGIAVSDTSLIDARAVEDAPFSFVAHASQDVHAAGTIYHQRFTAAPASARGALVPLSRNAACTATRADGSAAHCGYTDGDLLNPGVVDPQPAAASPVTKVMIDLGAEKSVGEIMPRCTCTVQVSRDGATWFNVVANAAIAAHHIRYVAVSGASLAAVPEISVWPPWPDRTTPTALLPDHGKSGLGVFEVLGVIALVLVGYALGRRHKQA